MNENKFSLVISSDLDYEKMVMYINFGNNQVATLNSDKGEDQVEIEILDTYTDEVIWKLDYKSFVSTLDKAYKKLIELNKEET